MCKAHRTEKAVMNIGSMLIHSWVHSCYIKSFRIRTLGKNKLSVLILFWFLMICFLQRGAEINSVQLGKWGFTSSLSCLIFPTDPFAFSEPQNLAPKLGNFRLTHALPTTNYFTTQEPKLNADQWVLWGTKSPIGLFEDSRTEIFSRAILQFCRRQYVVN